MSADWDLQPDRRLRALRTRRGTTTEGDSVRDAQVTPID
jgi:hypothetical protein